jgi:serine/alanine adding enzyme
MRIVQEIDSNEWSQYVYNHPEGNIFQSPEMYQIYLHTKPYEPIFLALVNDMNEIEATLLSVVQREYTAAMSSLTARSIIWGGPLVKNNDDKALDVILEEYNKIACKKALYSEFRNLWNISDKIEIFARHGYQYNEHLNYIIDLTEGKNILFSKLSSSKRRQIKKAQDQQHAIIKIAEEEKDVIEYYQLLSSYYSRVVKKPLPPIEYFMQIFFTLVQKQTAKIFTVLHEGAIIGGMICPLSSNFVKKTIYELYICGSRTHNSSFPSVLATWAPIEWGAENNINYFDFMGAGKPNEYYGVREFKEKFGGTLVNYGRFMLIHHPAKYKLAQAGFKVWQHMKK